MIEICNKISKITPLIFSCLSLFLRIGPIHELVYEHCNINIVYMAIILRPFKGDNWVHGIVLRVKGLSTGDNNDRAGNSVAFCLNKRATTHNKIFLQYNEPRADRRANWLNNMKPGASLLELFFWRRSWITGESFLSKWWFWKENVFEYVEWSSLDK